MRLQRSTGILFAESVELQDLDVRTDLAVRKGYRWIRRAVRPWSQTLRNPVVGDLFELTRWEVPGAWLLMSPETEAAVMRICPW
jgi:hypothetical protein